MGHIKNVKVTNPKNVVVQLPGFITNMKWALAKGDQLEVYVSDDEQSITIRPKKIRLGGAANS